MRYILLLCFCLFSLTSHNAFADEAASIKLQNISPADSPLKFQVQKIGWNYNKVRIWGALTNSGTSPLQFVSVSFTAVGKDGEFLTRQKVFADPSKLDGGETGNIDGFILDTEGEMPAVIQFKVAGNAS